MHDPIELNCKHCETHIPARNINIHKAIANCPECDHVFSFEEDLDIARRKPEVVMPKNIESLELRSEINLYRRWWSSKFFGIGFFALFWNGFMIVWYTMALAMEAYPMMLFGTIHALVGIGMIYWVAAGIFNTTEVRATKNRLYIKHRPVPWVGNRELDVSQIDQLYTKMKVTQNKGSTSYSYEVHAVLKGGKQLKLISGLDSSEEALYIEQELERFLGIKDRPVSGEMQV